MSLTPRVDLFPANYCFGKFVWHFEVALSVCDLSPRHFATTNTHHTSLHSHIYCQHRKMAFNGRMSMARSSQPPSQGRSRKEEDGDAFMTLVRRPSAFHSQIYDEY